MNSSSEQTRVQIVDVPENRAGQRLDNFLTARLPGVPRSMIYRIIRTGQVRINGKRAKPMQKLKSGDQVRVPPVRLEKTGEATVPAKVIETLEAAVLFENEHFLACDKPAGLAVHAGSGIRWGVVDAFRQSRPGREIDLVHRLDRDTSGLLLLAKDPGALRFMQEQFRQRQTRKRYFTLLDGYLPEDKVMVDEPLLKSQRSGERFMQVHPDGKPAVTEFIRHDLYGRATFVEAVPITGRTHQIRAHARFLKLPCAGDPRYMDEAQLKFWRSKGLERLFLHAHALEFEDISGEAHHLSCPLPAELSAVLERL